MGWKDACMHGDGVDVSKAVCFSVYRPATIPLLALSVIIYKDKGALVALL